MEDTNCLIVPGSYKGTLESFEAVELIEKSLKSFLPDSWKIQKYIIADGGEGTLSALKEIFPIKIESIPLLNPVHEITKTSFGISMNTAYIESSKVIGLSLIPIQKRKPLETTSRGLGQLIRHVVDLGCEEIYITMGDSGIMDMGVGMLHELGAIFYSNNKSFIPDTKLIGEIDDIDFSHIKEKYKNIEFHGLVDTWNFLCGPEGQVVQYGKQKGLTNNQAIALETGFERLGNLLEYKTNQNILNFRGASASGGLCAPLKCIFNAQIEHTIDFFERNTNCHLSELLEESDIIITGEGRVDKQTKFGKVPFYVASKAKGECIFIIGEITEDGLNDIKQVKKDILFFYLDSSTNQINPKIIYKKTCNLLAKSLYSQFHISDVA